MFQIKLTSALVRALHLLDQLRRAFHPLLAFIAEADAFKHHFAVKADDPVAWDAVDALTIGVGLTQKHRKSKLVLFHERLDLADFLVSVQRENDDVFSIF